MRVAYHVLETAGPYVILLLDMDNGNALESSDEYSRGEPWRRDIPIRAEIGAIQEGRPKLAWTKENRSKSVDRSGGIINTRAEDSVVRMRCFLRGPGN